MECKYCILASFNMLGNFILIYFVINNSHERRDLAGDANKHSFDVQKLRGIVFLALKHQLF